MPGETAQIVRGHWRATDKLAVPQPRASNDFRVCELPQPSTRGSANGAGRKAGDQQRLEPVALHPAGDEDTAEPETRPQQVGNALLDRPTTITRLFVLSLPVPLAGSWHKTGMAGTSPPASTRRPGTCERRCRSCPLGNAAADVEQVFRRSGDGCRPARFVLLRRDCSPRRPRRRSTGHP